MFDNYLFLPFLSVKLAHEEVIPGRKYLCIRISNYIGIILYTLLPVIIGQLLAFFSTASIFSAVNIK
jgi:hypothetical protein